MHGPQQEVHVTPSTGKRRRRRRFYLGAISGFVLAMIGAALNAVLDLGPQARALLAPSNTAEFWALVEALGTAASAALTVVVVVIAAKGLRSLESIGLTRKDMLTRAERDSRASAIHRCEEFAREILPMNGPLLNGLAAANVPVFVTDANQVAFDPDNESQIAAASRWWDNLPQQVRSDAVALLNRLEAWSMYFTKRLASYGVASGPCAPMFCSMVVQNYAGLLTLRNLSDSSGKYPNLVEVFKLWIQELEEEKRGLKEGDLLKQLKELQAKGVKTAPPKPLGTDIDD